MLLYHKSITCYTDTTTPLSWQFDAESRACRQARTDHTQPPTGGGVRAGPQRLHRTPARASRAAADGEAGQPGAHPRVRPHPTGVSQVGFAARTGPQTPPTKAHPTGTVSPMPNQPQPSAR